ncbi:hypothetical protein JCM3774_006539 [Rhodotorula dairenensis]
MAAVHPVPPSWKDLGKSASDLLNKDFPLAGNALEVKTRAPNGVAFKVAGLRDAKSAAIAGDLEAKYSDVKNGVTLTQTWTTSNVLKTQVELENQVAKGLKLDIQGHLLPATQGKSAYVTAIYRQPSVHTRALLDVFKGPTFTADAVIGRDGFLLGAESTYSVPSGAVTRYALGLGYAAPTYTVTLHGLANLSVFSASYYHKVSKDVEAGAKAIWDSKSTASQVGLEVGTKCYLDNTAFVKAKINSVGVAALGYTQALRPGVKASFGLAVDTAKLGEASHKVGTSLTFEASHPGSSTSSITAEPTPGGGTGTGPDDHEAPTAATRVATILCTVIPVLVVVGIVIAGALWFRHRRSVRKRRRGWGNSTIVVEGEEDEEQAPSSSPDGTAGTTIGTRGEEDQQRIPNLPPPVYRP